MKFKDRLKELRESKNLTQSDLANELNGILGENSNIYTQTISYWENGREPSYEVLSALSTIFNVSADYLIGKSDLKQNELEGVFSLTEMDFLSNLDNKLKQLILDEIYNFKDNILALVYVGNDTNDFDILNSLLKSFNKLYKLYSALSLYQVEKKNDFDSKFMNNTLYDSKEKYLDFIMSCFTIVKNEDKSFSIYVDDLVNELDKVISNTKYKTNDILYGYVQEIIKNMLS